jgi:hypothetical protein
MKITYFCYLNWKMILSEHLTLLLWLGREAPLFFFFNLVIGHIIEEGIFMSIKRWVFEKER